MALAATTDFRTDLSANESTDFAISGMTCQNCARHVTEAILGVPGVANATVDLQSQRAAVKWSADAPANVQAVQRAVKAAGYEAAAVESGEEEEACHADAGMSGWRLNLLLGVPITTALVLGEWVFGLGMTPWFRWTAFALATVVQFFCGARFYRGAWRQLQARSSNMDTLVALGSTTAYAYSIWALFQGTHVYFMEAAAIITLISAGHWMETRMSARAASSLRKLLHLAPPQARRREADGSETAVSVSELRIGDVIVLRPGERIPIDGKVIEGDSAVDESMLTGESVPIDKSAGALAYGGTMNLNGRLVIEVTAVGGATALAQIIAAVQRAQNSRANIQRLGDRVSSVFVPIVVVLAAGTALWWGLSFEQASQVNQWLSPFLWPVSLPAAALAAALVHCAAVLIIACPCAMGLATPTAIMAGTNVAADRGILIRDGVALEKAGTITTVVFDKTGTLTQGRADVAQFESYVGGKGRPLVHEMKLAAALARQSNHPLSQAIAKTFSDEFSFLDWEEVRGSGVQARLYVGDHLATARLGSLKWLQENGVDLARGKAFIDEWGGQGASLVGIAVEQWLMGLLAVQDMLKPGVPDVIGSLRQQKYEVYLVSGDNVRTAAAVGERAGIDGSNVAAEVRPEQKAEFVKHLQQAGKRVAFVGDGINDAPALEQADLGIAVGRASDIAQMAADIILLKSDIHSVPESLGLARATLRTIRQNLFWAFFYNAAGIPLAALGFMSPVLCALAMGLSDIVVIGNALRLRRWRPVRWRNWKARLASELGAESSNG